MGLELPDTPERFRGMRLSTPGHWSHDCWQKHWDCRLQLLEEYVLELLEQAIKKQCGSEWCEGEFCGVEYGDSDCHFWVERANDLRYILFESEKPINYEEMVQP